MKLVFYTRAGNSLKSNERLWAIRSDHSRQMSNREQITHKKWAKKFWLKKSKIFFLVCFTYVFLLKKWVIRSFPLFGERCERIAQVAHQKWAMWENRSGYSPKMSDHEPFAQVAQRKWAIVSESLRSLTKNERMSKLFVFFEQIAHSLIFG